MTTSANSSLLIEPSKNPLFLPLMFALNQLRVVLDLIVIGQQLPRQGEVDFGFRRVFPFHRDYASAGKNSKI